MPHVCQDVARMGDTRVRFKCATAVKAGFTLRTQIYCVNADHCAHLGRVFSGTNADRDIHVNPERSFGGTDREPPSEASQLRKGGPGVVPRIISKTYIANGAIYICEYY